MVNAAVFVTVKFGAFEVVPPVVPKVTVAVANMFRVKPPVPVNVKPVAVAIDNTVAAAVVLVSAMFPEPNEIARVVELEELKIPVLRVKPASARVPAVNVVVFVIPAVIASASVTVPPTALTVIPAIVFPRLVKVPVAAIVGP